MHGLRALRVLRVLALAAAALAPAFPCAAAGGGIEVSSSHAWIEQGDSLTVEQVARGTRPWVAVEPGQVHELGEGRTLWWRLRLRPVDPGTATWALEIPVPLLDYAALHAPLPGGGWSMQRAGDSLPVSSWSRPGRHPSFDFRLPGARESTVYLEVRHRDPIGFVPRILAAAQAEQGRLKEHLFLGMVLGTLVLLAASCLILGVIHRDLSYAWYAAFVLVMALTMATITGVAGLVLWSESATWTDDSQGVMPVLLAGVNLLFLRHLCGVAARHRRVARVALIGGLGIVALSGIYAQVGSVAQSVIVSASLVVSLVLGVGMALLAWRRHDVVGGWVLLAYTPLALSVAVALLRLFGLVRAGWLTVDASALSAALAAPLLLLALNARSRDWHAVHTRVNKLTEQDALTGLLSAQAFDTQLHAAVGDALMRRQGSALVVVELANWQEIRHYYGGAMAEQCLLRAVVKLQRIVRESDPAGRIDTARFGLILQGMVSREAVQQRMVQLVASGLTTQPGARLEVPLHFHVCFTVLSQQVLAPAVLMRRVDEVLSGMSSRTRRPIRFLDLAGVAETRPSQPDAVEAGAAQTWGAD